MSTTRRATAYLLSLPEALQVADTMGWTATRSLRGDGARVGAYTTTRPSRRLLTLLEPHRMGPGRWRTKFEAARRNAIEPPAHDAPAWPSRPREQVG